MKSRIIHKLWWVVFILSLVLLIIHSFGIKELKVDSTSILLLALILTSPFISVIKKIKYGDFEAEIDSKEIKNIKSSIESNTTLNKNEVEDYPEIFKTVDEIKELANKDKVLALAKLRIELESNLKLLAERDDVNMNNVSLGSLVKKMSNSEIISSQTGKSLLDVISVCNRAIHGEDISQENATTIVYLGIDLLEDLFWSIREQVTTGAIIKEEIIEKAVVEEFIQKKYKLTTVIPLVEEPVKIVRELTQGQLNDFLEGYLEYAEFIVELVEIEGK